MVAMRHEPATKLSTTELPASDEKNLRIIEKFNIKIEGVENYGIHASNGIAVQEVFTDHDLACK